MNEESMAHVPQPTLAEVAAEANVSGETCPAAQRRTTDGTPSAPATDSGQVGDVSCVDRIASHPDLTPAMRQRLAELVRRQPPAEGPPQIGLADVLALLAETIPSQLRLAAGELPTAPHPEGEAFFSGDPASDADKHAAAVATEQLALSGLLRR
jgi:hypothetical protein